MAVLSANGQVLLASCVNGGGVFLVGSDGAERLSQVDTTGLAATDDGWLMARQAEGVAEIRRARGGQVERIFLDHASYDLHDLLQHDDRIYVAATALNAVLELDGHTLAELHRWEFPGEPDSQHINSICMHDGRLLATRFGAFATHRGYKDQTRSAGQVFDVRTGEVLVSGLSQPHTLRSSQGQLWVCDSEARTLRSYVDFLPGVEIPLEGYVRGLAFDDDCIHVGLSRGRNDPSSPILEACVLTLDRGTWARRRMIPLPVDEVYDLLLLDIPAAELRMSALQEAFSEVDSMRHGRNLSSQAAHDHSLRATAFEHAAHGAALRGEALASQVAALQAQQHEQARDLRNLQAEGVDQAAWIGMLEAQVASQRESLAAWDAQAHAIAAQQAALEERDRFIESLLGSRSWRWTRPLRRAQPTLPAPLSAVAVPAPPTFTARRVDLPIADLSFTAHDHPDVSIVVASYGHFDATLACLRSIRDAGARASFEVLLAEDCPEEGEMDRFAHVPGLHYRRNAGNLGYGASMNAAVQRARGIYIHLLNNDTTVSPGWLDALLRTFALFGDCGIAGSRLVHPDGSLQEAGGIVWSDGSGCNYGRGDSPALPAYQAVREVDYVSAASLLVRTSVWQALGGFDARYAPAYYEDTDLAFRVRAAGLRVYFQPQSCVVHHEGLSHGTDLQVGGKAGQLRNQAVFVDRWRDTLQRGQLAPGEHAFLARERSQLDHTILVVDRFPPQSDRDAGSRAIWQLLHVLRLQGWRVKFWSHEAGSEPGYADNLRQHGIELLDSTSDGSLDTWIARNGGYLDAVLLSRPVVAFQYIAMLRDALAVPLIFYGHDIHHLRLRGEFALTGESELLAHAASLQYTERVLWRTADLVLYPSDSETQAVDAYLADVAGPGAAMTIPLFAYEDVDTPAVGPDDFAMRDELLFVGGFAHQPNVDGVAWFLREVWPLVHEALPDIGLRLVGADPPQEIRDLAGPGVHVDGHVGEHALVAAYGRARLAVAPLRFGAGTKGKVIEAMRHGVPCVATVIGAQGLGDASHLAVADDPSEMAALIIALAGDHAAWAAASVDGVAYVRTRFSVAAVWAVLGSVLDVPPYPDVASRRAELQRRLPLQAQAYPPTPLDPIPSHSE